jgi:GH35 family endo-1,4-beta-xylanase
MKRSSRRWSSAFVLLCLGAVTSRGDQPPGCLIIPARDASIKTEGGPAAGGWNLWSNGRVGQRVSVPRTGDYVIVIRAWGSPAGGIWPAMALLVDELEVRSLSVDRARPADYRFQVRLEAGPHEVAAAFSNDARLGDEDRNLYLESFRISAPADSPAPIAISGKPDPQISRGREQDVLRETEPAIERNRKSDLLVRVLDSTGRPIPGAKVTAELTNHEFLFGCNIYGFRQSRSAEENQAYQQRFAALFNYATVGFYWRWYEAERGKPRYRQTDEVVAWCSEHGIRMKGHPLLWGDNAGIPAWSAGQPDAVTQRERVAAIMGRYNGKIGFYEVVNEPSHLPLPLIDEPYRWARAVDPTANLIVNDYHVLADGAPAFHRLLTEAIAHGVPFDGIGIQAHEPRTMRFPLDRVRTILDRYAALGKELHITEFTPASSGHKITGSYKDSVWDEAAQADYAEAFYRVCFAHPAVRAITWWDLSDQHSWLKGGGMLRADMSPKPVYERLKKLIHEEWVTRLEGTTNAPGQFGFRGFRGTYRLKVEHAGRTIEKTFQLGKGDRQELNLTLAD